MTSVLASGLEVTFLEKQYVTDIKVDFLRILCLLENIIPI